MHQTRDLLCGFYIKNIIIEGIIKTKHLILIYYDEKLKLTKKYFVLAFPIKLGSIPLLYDWQKTYYFSLCDQFSSITQHNLNNSNSIKSQNYLNCPRQKRKKYVFLLLWKRFILLTILQFLNEASFCKEPRSYYSILLSVPMNFTNFLVFTLFFYITYKCLSDFSKYVSICVFICVCLYLKLNVSSLEREQDYNR